MSESIAEFRVQLRGAAERRVRTRRRHRRAGLVTLALLGATVCTGITVAATGWLHGTPAPPEVVDDFRSYTPQLGFRPQSGRAQLVARDGEDYTLYATVNREGTYCIVTSAPWKRPGTLDDGGTCVPKRDAQEPIAAGISGAGAVGEDREGTIVVTGRVLDRTAREIRFALPSGDEVKRPIGAGGFFIAAVSTRMCPDHDWAPTFTAVNADGDEVARAAIPLVELRRDACGFSFAPHGPAATP